MSTEETTRVLFFPNGTTDEDKKIIRLLVRKNYPGLLENGYVTWKSLDEARFRRAGGFTKNVAQSIVDLYNEKVLTKKFDKGNMKEWPSNVHEILRWIGEDPSLDVSDIPEPPPDGSKQLVYTPFPKHGWDEQSKKAYQMMVNAMKTQGNYIVNPWRHEENKEHERLSRWNLLLNQSVGTIAVNSNKDTANLRIVVPQDFTMTMKTQASKDITLQAIILLRYKDEDGHMEDTQSDPCRQPPNMNKNGFIPLFVFTFNTSFGSADQNTDKTQKRKESYFIFNYMGNAVDWGDYSKRKSYTYYELRDVMAHLASADPEHKWYMFEVSERGAPLRHFLVTKNKDLHDISKRVCINWYEEKKSLKFESSKGDCEYEGMDNDFMRFTDFSAFATEDALTKMLKREDLITDTTTYDVDSSNFEINYDISKQPESPTYIGPRERVVPSSFGIYGVMSEYRTVKEHMRVAYTFWQNLKGADNPLIHLNYVTQYLAGNWILLENNYVQSAGRSVGWWTTAVIGFVAMGISAVFAPLVQQ